MSIQIYRDYYHIKRGDEGFDEDSKTNFLKSGESDWWCTCGSWYGSVKGGNEYSLHHAYGKVEYEYYEEYSEEVEDNLKFEDGFGLDYDDDIPF